MLQGLNYTLYVPVLSQPLPKDTVSMPSVIHSPLYVNQEFSAILEKIPNSKPCLNFCSNCQKELEKGLHWAFKRQSDVK